MFCRKCGRQIDDRASFCNYCGTSNKPVEVDVANLVIDTPSHSTTKKSMSKKWLIIITAGILLIVVALAIGITSQNKAKLTKQEAQLKIDSALEAVYQEAASDNFILQTLKKTVKINVNSVKQAENKVFADCTVTSLDIATPILDYIQNLEEGSVDNYANVIIGLTDAISDAPETQKSFQIEFIQANDEYKPVFSEELVVFCSGNVHDLLPKLYTILQGDGIE